MIRAFFQSLRLGLGQLIRHLVRRLRPWPNVIELSLEGEVVEDQAPFTWLQRFFPRPVIGLRELILALRDAEGDPEISILLLYLGPNSLGWGRAQELRQAIQSFRAAGKKAVAFIEEADTLDYFLATACDQIIFAPLGSVGLTGLLSEVIYFKGILDKLAIQPELLQAGKYKSAVEPYTRTGPSPAQSESINSLLDSLYEQLATGIAEGRGLATTQVRDLIDQGPYLAADAREAGLVDYLFYEDELEDHLKKELGAEPVRASWRQYRWLRGPGLDWRDPWRSFPALAVVYATGLIHSGESRSYGGGNDSVGSDTLCEVLCEVREDPSVKAVVLRVDSPGGSGLASDLIWREMSRFRGKKPVVVSMGDVAASGGYYIAAPADRIFAQPGSLTGSIGVISGKLNLQGLYEKVGLTKVLVARGRNADLHSDYGPFSESGRRKVEAEMESFYREFVNKAAAGRRQEYARLEKNAQGRVWTGEQAKALDLVDGIGGLRQAIEAAKQLAGIPVEQKTLLEILPRRRRFQLPGWTYFLPYSPRLSPLWRELFSLEAIADSRILALLPFRLRIR